MEEEAEPPAEPDGDGGWHMAEVKSSTKAKDYHLGDLATQLWVARQAGLTLSSAAIRHINSSFVLEREGDFVGLLADTDLVGQAEPVVAMRHETVAAARTTLDGPEPSVSPGAHCEDPFPCDFAGYCHRDLPPGPEWPVTVLPHGGGKRWLDRGIDDLLAVDPAALTSVTHKRVHHATLEAWDFPRIWLDFETIGFAVPRWIGTRPFQQVPFQFSAHVEDEQGGLEHHEFLSLDGNDPRRACAEALVDMIPATGAVISYNAGFEKGRIVELAEAFPDLAEQLMSIAARVVDLLPVTRANWYHRDQRGSWSIKAVLPTVAPELDYASLEVGDGLSAQIAYVEATHPATSPERKVQIERALKIYCGRDTEAMIVLARRLTSAEPGSATGEHLAPEVEP